MKMSTDPYVLSVEVPTIENYLRLRPAAGLSAKSPEAAALGLPNTWHAVQIRHGGEPVGMGRVIGDGGCFFQVVDICVLPAHQGRGLGKRIMAELIGELERRAPAGAYVSLIADGEARHLYEKFGFRQTAPASVGMHRTV
ncbi:MULTISPECIES: GNAT family N-acetyltransferase [Streptomyces]|uniref:GNAT family N-acetyltransferase n=1 Tax=Streptomyces TaxID=1883 RepID=UPI001FAB3A63|nr:MULTISPECIES: GNAT family N-acetyltransferase [Streptomyces]MDX2919028.1 GNAT family N-acetyltransferase [Streptomyces sp. NE06-03C]MDX3608052.1 GNAT family N-acetyltransferase [Streptomyces sp. FL06-04B]MDX3738753.1 GNAT family N-acetyltransferase [Streptomyces sp. ID01-15D]